VCTVTQVAAQTGHSVVLVDQTEAILQKAKERIASSLKRVASKQYKDDAKVSLLCCVHVCLCVVVRLTSKRINSQLSHFYCCDFMLLVLNYSDHLNTA